MWDLKLLLYLILLTNTTVLSVNTLKHSTSRLSLRDELIHHLRKENPHDSTETVAESFDLCQPGVERAAICEVVVALMDVGSMQVENHPCTDSWHLEASFPCKTADALLFDLRSNRRENTISLEMDGQIHGMFTVPMNNVKLVNPHYVRYIRMYNWLKLASRTEDEIKAELDVAELPVLYETAIQLTVTKVETCFEEQDTELKGFDLCDVHINKGLLCQAINVRLYGESYFIANESYCYGVIYPYFECELRFVGSLRISQGIMENTVFLLNSENQILYTVTVPMFTNSLIITYTMPEIPLAPEEHDFLPDESETWMESDTLVSVGRCSFEAESKEEEKSSSREAAAGLSGIKVPKKELNSNTSPSSKGYLDQAKLTDDSPGIEILLEQSKMNSLSSPKHCSSQHDPTTAPIEMEVLKGDVSLEGFPPQRKLIGDSQEAKILQEEPKDFPPQQDPTIASGGTEMSRKDGSPEEESSKLKLTENSVGIEVLKEESKNCSPHQDHRTVPIGIEVFKEVTPEEYSPQQKLIGDSEEAEVLQEEPENYTPQQDPTIVSPRTEISKEDASAAETSSKLKLTENSVRIEVLKEEPKNCSPQQDSTTVPIGMEVFKEVTPEEYSPQQKLIGDSEVAEALQEEPENCSLQQDPTTASLGTKISKDAPPEDSPMRKNTANSIGIEVLYDKPKNCSSHQDLSSASIGEISKENVASGGYSSQRNLTEDLKEADVFQEEPEDCSHQQDSATISQGSENPKDSVRREPPTNSLGIEVLHQNPNNCSPQQDSTTTSVTTKMPKGAPSERCSLQQKATGETLGAEVLQEESKYCSPQQDSATTPPQTESPKDESTLNSLASREFRPQRDHTVASPGTQIPKAESRPNIPSFLAESSSLQMLPQGKTKLNGWMPQQEPTGVPSETDFPQKELKSSTPAQAEGELQYPQWRKPPNTLDLSKQSQLKPVEDEDEVVVTCCLCFRRKKKKPVRTL